MTLLKSCGFPKVNVQKLSKLGKKDNGELFDYR